MALDVFHQVLSKLLETAGGNPKKMVSATDVLKQEKLFGSAEMILNRLHSEGWITDAPAKDHVFVTVWGIEELERVARPGPSAAAASRAPEPKNAAALREAAEKARGLATLLEELATGAGGGTPAQRKAKAKKSLGALSEAVDEAFG